jgi:hypothetical protein
MNAINTQWEDTVDSLSSRMPTATDAAKMQHECAVLKYTCSTLYTANAAEVGILPASVFCILTEHLGKKNLRKLNSPCDEQ